ncbi:DUF2617 family protein [Streptomonospora sp. S1-112]|uniref:DUF2617 family protein n=1 Tax=Streptomonospora mangrovi TaxID=2883123 RepID=A0A9X3NPV9_9ACTN|nr:DUF2617 family protein [Streptomonospora mangrovi]MDA0567302.1 DUF2617 family protein [Streptomonospora mangrovi]
MHTALSAPFVDTRAADLTWTLAAPHLPALLTRTARVAGYRIVLRVLGASHQVELAEGGPGGAGWLLTETVACLPGAAGGLPDRARPAVAGLASYTFTSSVAVPERAAFTDRVERLRAAVERDPRGVVASFPGDPHAITALLPEALAPGRVRWRTWHAYPQTRELVTTTTTCERPLPGHRSGKDV